MVATTPTSHSRARPARSGQRRRPGSTSLSPPALTASCHCGTVKIHVKRAPRTVTRCNCSLCRRYGALWAYYGAGAVAIEAPQGSLASYSWRRRVRAYFRCRRCGCVTHYKYRRKWGSGTVGVNAANFEPEVLERVRIRRLDGARTWTWRYEE